MSGPARSIAHGLTSTSASLEVSSGRPAGTGEVGDLVGFCRSPGGRAGAVAPAREGRLSSQSPRGSPAVYASWTTSSLPCRPWCDRILGTATAHGRFAKNGCPVDRAAWRARSEPTCPCNDLGRTDAWRIAVVPRVPRTPHVVRSLATSGGLGRVVMAFLLATSPSPPREPPSTPHRGRS
jgi:hypothetical protein